MMKKYTIGEFGKLTGTSARTLQYYDEIGLLKAERTAAGHRSYKEEDFATLQKIISLKFLGFSLDETAKYLRNENWDMKDSLVFQRNMMKKKREQLDDSIRLLNLAIEQIDHNHKLDPQVFTSIINSVQMEEEHKEWMKSYWPEEFVEQLYDRVKEDQEEYEKKMMDLFSRFKGVMFSDFMSPQVEKLVHELLAMATELTGESLSSLETLPVEDIPLDPWLFPNPFSPEEEKWLEQVMTYYMEKETENHAEE
ncbi:MerR family transcriptional regulator [Bacillus sp. FJAT-42315]|uniref:MerR family transcriptional regulator n=1 Tax=Bacillus sp. FJAT-42315 TaxID=2014077 RepID=UPI0012FF253A|nr:MerR family transcriptional regulator [Bacillus sp. FJAT-42315]